MQTTSNGRQQRTFSLSDTTHNPNEGTWLDHQIKIMQGIASHGWIMIHIGLLILVSIHKVTWPSERSLLHAQGEGDALGCAGSDDTGTSFAMGVDRIGMSSREAQRSS